MKNDNILVQRIIILWREIVLLFTLWHIFQCQVAVVAVVLLSSIVAGWVVKWRGLPLESIMPLLLGGIGSGDDGI